PRGLFLRSRRLWRIPLTGTGVTPSDFSLHLLLEPLLELCQRSCPPLGEGWRLLPRLLYTSRCALGCGLFRRFVGRLRAVPFRRLRGIVQVLLRNSFRRILPRRL